MKKPESNRSILLGAAFLMATSAVGPGFLTQTTTFTQTLAASFGFVILISIIIDIGVQMNIWRIITVSGKRAQEIANEVLPGLGVVLAGLVVLGGLAFNIGNIGGAGLGTNVLFGVSPEMGALFSGLIAIGIFLVREAARIMDRFIQVLGFLMIGLTVFVMFQSQPPIGEAITRSFVPETVDFLAIVTLVGGTVGGYITFAGGHRLLDAGLSGTKNIPEVNKSAVSAIGLASIIRIFLFLATLGVVAQGLEINPDNPPASVFQLAAGNIGYKIFGVVMWSAAISSVIGAAYTSVSFIKTFSPVLAKYEKFLIVGFITASTAIFTSIGQPVTLLILAGALNGLILPISLGVILLAAHNKKIVGDYSHPKWLTGFGILIVVVMAYLGGYTMINQLPELFS
ncbi:NRAMP family divalent metal transporter [Jeotgalibacillus haloalkalitolerans]|uniref:NRAMP family divalent metal transporter n=1 Tax=Jeotgalibacillus haloalkalitolerans TaxID=3104292 RepID=A0ABU5KIH7_9BACL|nr:NRAMP family divalent metal transporter [Jeotgalibacillus sp. HH7-29]MDZ5710938.1 NRAMP family divalent metal transporter [Jeotgalibacillus sp. HH7-29]